MINKEEIEKAKERLKLHIEYAGLSLNGGTTTIVNRNDVKTILQYLSELEEENKRQKEINAEHQKLNGELQKKVTYYEEICKGKIIQELGMSDLYKED